MEHQVGVGHVVVGAREPAALEVVGGAVAAAREQPLQEHLRPVAVQQRRRHRHGLLAAVLHVHLEVVLQVLADARQVVDDVDAERLQLGGVADAGQLQQLRRVDRAAADDDLVGVRPPGRPAAEVERDARRPRAVEHQPAHERVGLHGQVRPVHDRVQVGAGGAQPAAAVDVAVEGRKALLAVAVDVGRELVAGLLDGLEERLEERARGRAALEHERAVAAAPLVGARQARLHLLEVRQAVGVVPRLHPGVARPALVVHRVAALEDHAVDAARAAEHLAAGVVDAPVVHVRLGLGLVLPVVEAAADRVGQRRRHVDEEVELVVVAAGLEHQDARRRIGAQAVRERRARRAAADDDVVIGRSRHVRLPGGSGAGRVAPILRQCRRRDQPSSIAPSRSGGCAASRSAAIRAATSSGAPSAVSHSPCCQASR